MQTIAQEGNGCFLSRLNDFYALWRASLLCVRFPARVWTNQRSLQFDVKWKETRCLWRSCDPTAFRIRSALTMRSDNCCRECKPAVDRGQYSFSFIQKVSIYNNNSFSWIFSSGFHHRCLSYIVWLLPRGLWLSLWKARLPRLAIYGCCSWKTGVSR